MASAAAPRGQDAYASLEDMVSRRRHISEVVRGRCNSVVSYGILKGYPVQFSRWGETVASSYLLGTYEPGVCAIIDRLKSPDKTLVDIGAADGVFGVGLVYTKCFGRSVCFELDPASQEHIKNHARKLGLADKVIVHGSADASLYDTLVRSNVDLANAVIISDIEGFEEYLFDDDLLSKLSQCNIIMEVHHEDHIIDAFARRCEKHFHVNRIRDGLRDVRNIPLISDLGDLDIYLSCSELRPIMMHWFWLSPKSEPKLSADDLDMLVLKYQRDIFAPMTWPHYNFRLYCAGAQRQPEGIHFCAASGALQTFGPYIYLDQGAYEVVIELAGGRLEGRLGVDVVAASGDDVILAYRTFERADVADRAIRFDIDVLTPTQKIEIRTYNDLDLVGDLLSISIERR